MAIITHKMPNSKKSLFHAIGMPPALRHCHSCHSYLSYFYLIRKSDGPFYFMSGIWFCTDTKLLVLGILKRILRSSAYAGFCEALRSLLYGVLFLAFEDRLQGFGGYRRSLPGIVCHVHLAGIA